MLRLTGAERDLLVRERSAYIGALEDTVDAVAEWEAVLGEHARRLQANIDEHGLDHPRTRVAFREFKAAEAEFEAAIDRYDADRQAFEPMRETLREYGRVLGPHRHRRGRAPRLRTNARRRGSRRVGAHAPPGDGDPDPDAPAGGRDEHALDADAAAVAP